MAFDRVYRVAHPLRSNPECIAFPFGHNYLTDVPFSKWHLMVKDGWSHPVEYSVACFHPSAVPITELHNCYPNHTILCKICNILWNNFTWISKYYKRKGKKQGLLGAGWGAMTTEMYKEMNKMRKHTPILWLVLSFK